MPNIDMNELNELLNEESKVKLTPKRKRPHAAARHAARKDKFEELKKEDEKLEEIVTNTEETKKETIMENTTTAQEAQATVEQVTETTAEPIKEPIMENPTAEEIKEESKTETIDSNDLVIVTPTLNHFTGMDIKGIEKFMLLTVGVKHGKITREEAIKAGDLVSPGVMEKIFADEYDLTYINKHNVFNDENANSFIDEVAHIGKSLVAVLLPSYSPVEKLKFDHYNVVVDENAPKSLRIGYAKGLMRHIADKLGLSTKVSNDYTALSLSIELRHTNVTFSIVADDDGDYAFKVHGLDNKHVQLVNTVNPNNLEITQFARLITGVAAVRY